MTEKERTARDAARAIGLPTTRYATSPKSGKTHRNWIPLRELEAMIAEANAGTPVAQIAAAHNATPGKPAPTPTTTPAPAPTPTPAPTPETAAPATPEAAPVAVAAPEAAEEATPDAPATVEKEATPAPAPEEKRVTPPAAAVDCFRQWHDFLAEFSIPASARLINTLARQKTADAAAAYLNGYAALAYNETAASLAAKLTSDEGKALLETTVSLGSTRAVNSRLAVYFGEPGSGKTTLAEKENPHAAKVVCRVDTPAEELFRGFAVTQDGKPAYHKSALREAMENGSTVILDEINLLPQDILRSLQSCLDNSPRVTPLPGETIDIRPGFRVVATMNLMINGIACGLPAALVDRADTIREFSLSPEAGAEYAGLGL